MPPGRVAAPVLAAGLATAACGASAGSPGGAATPASGRPGGPASWLVTLVVPPGEGGGALAAPRKLRVPAGWTARVWARAPGARMEAWTPDGDLLVSQPRAGTVVAATWTARPCRRCRSGWRPTAPRSG